MFLVTLSFIFLKKKVQNQQAERFNKLTWKSGRLQLKY